MPGTPSSADLRRLVTSVTDPNVHSFSVRDMETFAVLGIYADMQAAMHGANRPGHVTEIVVWHPAKCDCEDVGA